jgi:hypothetical protein
MNTLARQSISKTLVKACAAAILLVTCLNSQAADSNVKEIFANIGSETLASIQADLKTNTAFKPTLNDLSVALERSAKSQNFRAETLSSINADLKNENTFTPNLNLLSAALDNIDYINESEVLQS